MAELIRSFVQVSSGLPRSQWRRSLTHLQMLVWDDLIHHSTYCGVFAYDQEEAAWYYKVEITEISAALEIFERDGKIRTEGRYVWVVDFILHQSFNPSCLVSANKQLHSLAPRTSLASACDRHLLDTCPPYAGHVSITRVPSVPCLSLYDTIQDKTKLDTPENPESEPTPQPKPIAEEFLLLADQCQNIIVETQQTYGIPKLPTYHRDKAATTIRQIIQIDKIPADDLVPIITFGMLNDFWRTNMLSITNWRVVSKRNGLPKIANLHKAWTDGNNTLQPQRNGNGMLDYAEIGDVR